jgi:tetratricopeptide (TPR) repeat protein
MYRTLAIATVLALASACASPNRTVVPPEEAAAKTPVTPEVPAQEVAAEPPERPIPEDSLYPLLVAEFALRRKAYDTALQHYLEQAPILRDAAVSAHTTQLAQFMRRDQATREAAALWVELQPDNAQANATVATFLVREGNSPQALPHLAALLAAGGSPRFSAILFGFNELTAEQKLELLDGVDALAADYPEYRDLQLTQALIRTRLDRGEQALAILDPLIAVEPANIRALALEGQLKLDRGDADALARIEKTLEEQPGNAELRLQYAHLLTRVDVEAARAEFETLSVQSPRDGNLLFSLALINRELGDSLAAKAYLRQVLALGQRPDEANYYLGRIAEDEADHKTAIEAYQRVTDGRELMSAASRGGRLLLEAGATARSAAWFDELRDEHPERAEKLSTLEADLLLRADELDLALATLNRALVQHPDSSNLLYTRSMVNEQRDDLVAMEDDLRRIIAAEPDNATALNALGYTLANRTDRYAEAQALISQALAARPNEPAILDSMGWVLFRLGEYEQAINYLSQAYARFPDPEVAAHLGEVLWVSGDTNSARDVWRGALQQDPSHRVLLETLQRLGITDLRPAQP